MDDFFLLGGNSLVAMRAVNRINESFEIQLPLRRIFATPTVADLARAVAGLDRLPSVQQHEESKSAVQRYPLSFAQQRLWFLEQLEPGTGRYNIATAFNITGKIEFSILGAALNQVVRRHDALRTTFVNRE